MDEIDSCEHLIYFCARNRKDLKKDASGEADEETKAEVATSSSKPVQKTQVGDLLKAGKLLESVKAEEFDRQKVKPGKKKREGASLFYYEDDSALSLDYMQIKKFSKLGLSPPIDVDQLPKTQ